MLKDFRESFKTDLLDPEFQREFISASYEDGGADGVTRALREIAAACHGKSETAANANVLELAIMERDPAFAAVRAALNALGLDLAIVRKESRRSELGSASRQSDVVPR